MVRALTIGGLGLGSVETSSNEQDSSSGTFGKDIGDAQYSVVGVIYICSMKGDGQVAECREVDG